MTTDSKIRDYIRKHLLRNTSIDKPINKNPELKKLRKIQWSNNFELLMRNRLLFGAYRYGSISKNRGGSTTAIPKYTISLIRKYIETGNTEFLVDRLL